MRAVSDDVTGALHLTRLGHVVNKLADKCAPGLSITAAITASCMCTPDAPAGTLTIEASVCCDSCSAQCCTTPQTHEVTKARFHSVFGTSDHTHGASIDDVYRDVRQHE